MKLIYYEIKKLCSNPYLLGVAAVLLAASMIFFGMSVKEQSKYEEKYSKYIPEIVEMYETDPERFESEYQRIYDLMMSDDFIIEYIYGEEGVVDDYSLFSYVHDYVEADAEYHEKLDGVIRESERIKKRLEKVSEANKETFAYRYQTEVIEKYTYLDENVTLGDKIVFGWDSYFGTDTELIFVFAAVLIFAVYAATNDYNNGFYAIEKACVNGRGRTARAKYAALVILGAVWTAVFFVSSIAVTQLTVGLTSPFVPIQSVEMYRVCQLDVSIFGFLCLSFLLKLAVITVSLSVVMGVTSITRKNIYGIAVGALLLLSGFIMSGLDITAGDGKYINLWSAYNLSDWLGRYRALAVFGYSVPLIFVALCVFVLVAVIAVGLHIYGFSHVKKPPHKRALPRLDLSRLSSKIKLPRPKPRYGTRLLSYEHRKRLWILPLLAVLIVIKCDWAAEYYERTETTFFRIYREYLEEIGGKYTPAKAEYISEEYAKNQEIYALHDEVMRACESGEITAKQLSNFLSDYSAAQAKLPVLEKLSGTSDYLGRLYKNGTVGSFVNEYEYYRYANVGTDWYLTVFLWAVAVSAFMMERRKTSSSSPPEFLINTMPRGRIATLGAKFALTVSVSLVAALVFKSLDLLYHSASLEMPSADTLLVSLSNYAFAPASVTVGGHLVLVAVSSVVGAVLSATLFFFFAQLVRDTLSAFVLSAVLMFAPGLLTAAGVDMFKYIDIAKLTDTDAVYKLAGEAAMGVQLAFALVFAAIAAITAVIAAYSIGKVRKGN